MATTADRVLPSDPIAERSTLGSLLLAPDYLLHVAAWLEPGMFFDYRNQWIYQAMLALVDQRTRPDTTNVLSALRAAHTDKITEALERYVMTLPEAVPTAVNVLSYAAAVKRAALKREQIQLLTKGIELAFAESEPSEVADFIESGLSKASTAAADDDFHHISTFVDSEWERISRIQAEGTGILSGVPSGFRDLDDLTGGFQPGDLIIVAARPAVGKTSLALSMADHQARQHQRTVGILELEMSGAQLVQRDLALHTGIDTNKYRNGSIRSNDLQMVMDAMGILHTLPIYIRDLSTATIGEIKAKARRLQAQHGLDILYIDYLQLVAGERKKNDNRVQEIGQISRGLKALARELHIPIVALSQLSRAVEGRPSKVPMLSDLRESGDLEQDADLVMFIYREELYDAETDKKGVAELHLAKHRNGPTGVVALRFFNNTTRFADLERYRAPEGYGYSDAEEDD